jgi:hypothetical protein
MGVRRVAGDTIGGKIDKLTRDFDRHSSITTAAMGEVVTKVEKLYSAVYGNGKPGYAQRIALLEKMAEEESTKRSRRNTLVAGALSSVIASFVAVIMTALIL